MSHGIKSSHEENRKKVCGPCGNKIVFGKTQPEKFLINGNIEMLIKKFVSKDFDLNDDRFPLSICGSCRLTVLEFEKEIYKRQLQTMPNYHDLILSKNTRSKEGVCNCYICSTATFKGHTKLKKGRGHFREINNVINVSSGSNVFLQSNEQEQKSIETIQRNSNSIKVCRTCFQEIGKGIYHDCKNRRENIIKLIENVPEKSQEQLASYIIKKKTDSELSSKRSVKRLQFSTGGRKKRCIINGIENKQVIFSEENLDTFRIHLGLSDRKMIKVTNFIRCNAGKNSVPSNYREHMSNNSKKLEDIYKLEFCEFDCENTDDKKVRPVVYADAEELVNSVVENRNVQGFYVVKVMADGGQGFFKISFSIIPQNNSSEEPDNDELNVNDVHERSTYSEGGSFGKEAKVSSVNKLILLCVVPQIKETYENIKILFDLTKLNNIAFKFISDFKLLLIVNGQQTATSTCPCPYCFITLNDLKKDADEVICDDVPDTDSTDRSDQNGCMPLKTYKNLRDDYNKFCDKGKNKKLGKECHSTINLPLFSEDDDTYVLEKCIIPELHILQGFVNHLFWKGLVSLVGKEKALLWPQKLNLVSKNYHGDAFEGNACRKLLKEADALEDPQIYEKVGIFKIKPYVGAFKAMNKIVICSFTAGKVGPSLDAHIAELYKALKSIDDLSVTLKIHVILEHVDQSFSFIQDNNALGFWSEQSGESVHRDFLKIWELFKVSSIAHESYASQLLKAVTKYSSLHL